MLKDEQAELRAELDRLRKEVQERDDFLAFVAHELRNPMHALSLQLASARALAEAGRPVVDRITKTQATLKRYIDRATVLLDVAQHQRHQYQVSIKRLELSVLLVRMLDNARAEADYHGARLQLDAAPGCWIETDPLALEHVIGNLLSNAFKHSQCTEVLLSLREVGDFAQIVVADNGRGISLDDQLRVFNKYDRGAKPSLRGGSGLGLWIARQLIQSLNGTISLESRLNEGCRFVLQIPLISPTPAPTE